MTTEELIKFLKRKDVFLLEEFEYNPTLSTGDMSTNYRTTRTREALTQRGLIISALNRLNGYETGELLCDDYD